MFLFSKDGMLLSAIVDGRRPNSKLEYPVKIRVTYKRLQKYYPTGKVITLDD